MYKKILAIFLSVLVLSTVICIAAEQGNLCFNGMFSDGINGWSSWGVVNNDSENVYSGDSSVFLQGGQGEGSGIRQPVALRSYQTYTLGGIAMVQPGAGSELVLGIQFKAGGREISHTVTFKRGEFTADSITFTTPLFFSDCYIFVWNKNRTAGVWVDQIVLSKGETASFTQPSNKANTTQSNLIKNSGFESGGFEPWGSWGGLSVQSNVVNSGKNALAVGNNDSGNGGGGGYTDFSLKPFTTYTLSAYGNYSTAIETPGVFGMQWTDENGNTVTKNLEFTEGMFVKKSLTFTTPQSFTSPMLILVKVGKTQTFYLDDISLFEEKTGEFSVVVDDRRISEITNPHLFSGRPYLTDKEIALATNSVSTTASDITTIKNGKNTVKIDWSKSIWYVNDKQETSNVIREYQGKKYLAAVEIINGLGIWAGYSSGAGMLYASTKEVTAKRTKDSPKVREIYKLAPDMLGIRIDEGELIGSKLLPYVKQAGDRFENDDYDPNTGLYMAKFLIRNGERAGMISGPKEDHLMTMESVVGDKLESFFINIPESFVITNKENGDKILPTELYRKSKVSGRTFYIGDRTMEHYVYLKLPKVIEDGKYEIAFGGVNVSEAAIDFDCNDYSMRSEAIHSNQVGHRPDDLAKRAYLSIWLGTGGNYSYRDNMKFHLIDDKTKEIVYDGNVKFTFSHDKAESLVNRSGGNQTNTDVYEINYSDFKTPGVYRVMVEGVGVSHPITISEDAWEKAYQTSMAGYYVQRGSVDLGPPYSDFVKPRDSHPDDGYKMYQSEARLMDTSNGLRARNDDDDNFKLLREGKTDTLVNNAIGGYHDAADWDRHIFHIVSMAYQMDLLEDFPEKISKIKLSIPESGNGLPDTLNEALFAIDLYHKLQMPDGAIRGGFEYQAHPNHGEVSWLNTQYGLVYAPDCYSSFIYAWVVSKISVQLAKYGDQAKAKELLDSAIKAMQWGETDYKELLSDEKATKEAKATVRDYRNAAALELYVATKDKKWHDLFLTDTVYKEKNLLFSYTIFDQRFAAYKYARLPDDMVDVNIKANCIDAFLKEAEDGMTYIDNNAFNLGYCNDMGQPLIAGFHTVPQPNFLAQCYVLTKDEKYMEYLEKAAHFSSGANPMNKTGVVGLGYSWPKEVLKLDSRVTGQDAPVGIAVYGVWDLTWEHWANQWVYEVNIPELSKWPNNEGFFDAFGVPMAVEWTVGQTISQGTYLWGVLAGRD